MWTLKLKAKMFVALFVSLIVADLMVGVPSQSRVSLVAPQNSTGAIRNN